MYQVQATRLFYKSWIDHLTSILHTQPQKSLVDLTNRVARKPADQTAPNKYTALLFPFQHVKHAFWLAWFHLLLYRFLAALNAFSEWPACLLIGLVTLYIALPSCHDSHHDC